MADTKISALDAATVLNDADLIPIVQGGVNKKLPASIARTIYSSDAKTIIEAQTDLIPVGVYTDSHDFTGVIDHRLWLASNMKVQAGELVKAVAGQPHMALVFENNYNGAYVMDEVNLDWYDTDGNQFRALHWDMNRSTELMNWFFACGANVAGDGLVLSALGEMNFGGGTSDGTNRVWLVGSDNAAHNALRVASAVGDGTPILTARNDGRLAIGKDTFVGGTTYLDVVGGEQLDGGALTIVNAPTGFLNVSGDAASQLYWLIKNTHDTGSASTRNLQFVMYLKPGVSTLPGEVQLFCIDDADYRTLAIQPYGGHIKFKGDQYDIPSARLAASQWSIRLDEASNTIKFIAKYADGTTIKTGTVALS